MDSPEVVKVLIIDRDRRVAAKVHGLCCYISRPVASERRLSLTPNRKRRYQFKTPYRESLPRELNECFGHGTTHVILEPLDFIARLAAPVQKSRVNLTRFHGVFAPNRQLGTAGLTGKGCLRFLYFLPRLP